MQLPAGESACPARQHSRNQKDAERPLVRFPPPKGDETYGFFPFETLSSLARSRASKLAKWPDRQRAAHP